MSKITNDGLTPRMLYSCTHMATVSWVNWAAFVLMEYEKAQLNLDKKSPSDCAAAIKILFSRAFSIFSRPYLVRSRLCYSVASVCRLWRYVLWL